MIPSSHITTLRSSLNYKEAVLICDQQLNVVKNKKYYKILFFLKTWSLSRTGQIRSFQYSKVMQNKAGNRSAPLMQRNDIFRALLDICVVVFARILND